MIVHANQEKALIVVRKGEKLIETLTREAAELDLKGGVISGLGALVHVELGYYHLQDRKYLKRTFSDQDYELISLVGNLSLREQQVYLHVHASLGDEQFRVFGGHLFEAEVAVTAEISIIPMGRMPVREWNEEVGLATLCPIR